MMPTDRPRPVGQARGHVPRGSASPVPRGPASLVVVAALLALSACQASAPTVPTPTPVPPIEYTVRSAGSTLPSKPDSMLASDILSARLRSMAVGTFSISIGDAMTFTIPASADATAVKAVLSATGQVAFVPLPVAEYGNAEKPGPLVAVAGQPLPSAEKALFGGDQITAARATVETSGGPALSITLATDGARLFSAYTSANVGGFFAVMLDGRVVAVPLIQVAITDGALIIALPPDASTMPVDALAAIVASGPLPDSWKQGP
jgi:hypothetical protein